jgi:hypothetical protein
MTDDLAAKAAPAVERAAEAFMQWTTLSPDGATVEIKPGKALPAQKQHQPALPLQQGADIGVNLGFSNDAGPKTARKVMHWELLNRDRTPVKTRDWLCICNMHGDPGEPLIYFEREIGGNVGWPSSETLIQQGLDWGQETVQQAVTEYLKSKAGSKRTAVGDWRPRSRLAARPHRERPRSRWATRRPLGGLTPGPSTRFEDAGGAS